MRSIVCNPQLIAVCNQSEGNTPTGDAIHATRDYIRLTAITYQSFGLDKNKALPKKCFIFMVRVTGLEPAAS